MSLRAYYRGIERTEPGTFHASVARSVRLDLAILSVMFRYRRFPHTSIRRASQLVDLIKRLVRALDEASGVKPTVPTATPEAGNDSIQNRT